MRLRWLSETWSGPPKVRTIDCGSAKQRLVNEANDALQKAVSDRGLSVDEYNGVIRAAKTDPCGAGNLKGRVRHIM
jgi:hypothetical protein